MTKKNTTTVIVEKHDNQYLLRLQSDPSKTLGWPKILRPPNPDDFVGKQLSITHSGSSVESVRCEDPAWERPEPQVAKKKAQRGQRPVSRQSFERSAKRHSAGQSQTASEDFVNPYNFVPFAGDPKDNPEGLAPALPQGHDRLVPDTHTGVLEIRLKTVTPLLLVDQSRAQVVGGHKTLPCRIGQDGRPQLPASAVRGVLRSAFEAVTNSAFGVFDRRWANPLAMRNPARSALNVRLARVSRDGSSLELQEKLEPGVEGWQSEPGELLPDPWIPLNGRESRYEHLSEQDLKLELWFHQPKGGQGGFYFWRDAAGKASPGRSKPVLVRGHKVTRQVSGVAYSTGKTIGMKHDDRFFVTHVDDEALSLRTVPLAEELRRSWAGVIASYLAAAKDRKESMSMTPLYVRDHDKWAKLEPGTMCFATLDSESGQVTRITPAMISRTPFSASPSELTQGHLPSTKLADLTAAERVFGWVSGDASHAGQLRIDQPKCQTDQWRARDVDAQPLELATLSGPKPAYYRFYVDGHDNSAKSPDRGFVGGATLRGWKTYVHHASLPEDFESYVRVRTYVEKRKPNSGGAAKRPDAQPSCKVTLSVRDWVKPEVEFTTKLRVRNLNDAEMGALLWLLEDGTFRMGLGKPLGFGTVSTQVEGWTPLNPGQRYLGQDAPPDRIHELRAGFESLWEGRARHLAAFRQAMQGWADVPVEYPHVQSPSGYRPQGQPGYLWFVENERTLKQSLPPVSVKAPTLPWFEHAEEDMKRIEEVRRNEPCALPSRGSRARRQEGKRPGKAAPSNQRRRGRVKTFAEGEGYGLIAGDDGPDYFVHISDVKGGSLAKGQRVSFEAAQGNRGPVAKNVTVRETN